MKKIILLMLMLSPLNADMDNVCEFSSLKGIRFTDITMSKVI